MDRLNRQTTRRPASFKLGASGQRGLSIYGWLAVMVIAAGVLISILRLGPHYIDYNIVIGIMDRLPAEEVHSMPRDKIREHFNKQFRIENFRIPLKDIMTIERGGGQTVLDINYEVREHMVYNVDVVLSFSEKRTYK